PRTIPEESHGNPRAARILLSFVDKGHVSIGTLLGGLGLASSWQVGGRFLAGFWLDEQFEDLAFEHCRDLSQ
ncbi:MULTISPECIES: hypothetical protein, partial [unclassified Ensifer]|uniref:hypothetical protein n=1 Tax=unclassified Ensifer TaxID=2633371 RepID=UPI00300F960B